LCCTSSRSDILRVYCVSFWLRSSSPVRVARGCSIFLAFGFHSTRARSSAADLFFLLAKSSFFCRSCCWLIAQEVILVFAPVRTVFDFLVRLWRCCHCFPDPRVDLRAAWFAPAGIYFGLLVRFFQSRVICVFRPALPNPAQIYARIPVPARSRPRPVYVGRFSSCVSVRC
jgi:hypothetical protein